MKKATRRRKPKSAHLLGVVLDDDGHKRLTSAEQFTIVGGSEETHGRMTETVIKTFETLKLRHKSLHAVEPHELAEIIQQSTPGK